MSFFSRLLVPPGMRRAGVQDGVGGRSGVGGKSRASIRARAGSPARAWKGFATAKAAKKARRSARPADNAVYFVERSVTTRLPSAKKVRKITREWRHGKCEVKHRSAEAAARCRNP